MLDAGTRFEINQWADLLGPGIRQALFRYGSMREVTVSVSSFGHFFLVKYELITGETKTVEVPYKLAAENRYRDILRLITKDLGQFPSGEE